MLQSKGIDAPASADIDSQDTKPERSTWQRSENIVAYLMTLPTLIPFLLFSVLPLFWILYISFTQYNGVGQPEWIGLANYSNVINDTEWWQVVLQTFRFAVGKLAIEIPLALTLAIILNSRLRGSLIYRTLIFIPHVTSIAVMGVVFFFLLRPFNGVVNGILQTIGVLGNRPIDFVGDPDYAMMTLILVSVWYSLGLTMMLFLAGLQSIPEEILESAQLDGANWVQRTRFIIAPMLGGTFRIVVMLSIIFTLRSFDLIKVLTDGGPFGRTDVMFTYIFDYFFTTDFNRQYGYGAALGVTAAGIITIISIAYNFWSRDTDNGDERA